MLGVWSQEILEATEMFVEVYSALHRTGNLQSSRSMQRRRPKVIGHSDTSDSTNSSQAEIPRVRPGQHGWTQLAQAPLIARKRGGHRWTHNCAPGAPASKKALVARPGRETVGSESRVSAEGAAASSA